MDYHIETKCICGDGRQIPQDPTGALSFPIYQTASFTHPGVGKSTGYDYSRQQNPTRERLERVVASLENGVDALAFSSGMAAIDTVMELFRPGDHVISCSDLYGGTIRLFHSISRKNQLSFTFVDPAQQTIESCVRPNTRAIYLETPTNPMMNVVDIAAAAETAHRHGLLLVVDNTFLSPYFQNPLDLGADLVVHGGTKFLGGHNDTLAGFVVTGSQELAERLRFILKTVGACLAPFDSWLILRGIKTLALRMSRAQENALEIAAWLERHARVCHVCYPGLPSHPAYELSCRQSRGFGSMVTFQTDTKETALHVLSHVHLIHFAESLGGVETLITYPSTQTHADMSPEERARNGITDTTLRLSVGVECVEDLLTDLEQAFG